jgi:hypothetical protein
MEQNTMTRVVNADSIPLLNDALARARYAVLFDCADYAAEVAESRERDPANHQDYTYGVERVANAEVPFPGCVRLHSGYVIVIRDDARQIIGYV